MDVVTHRTHHHRLPIPMLPILNLKIKIPVAALDIGASRLSTSPMLLIRTSTWPICGGGAPW
jgi:hypothetical protein